MNPRWLVRGLVAFCMVSINSTAEGYELITHARISQGAFDVSAGLKKYFEDVGIDTDRVFDPDNSSEASTAFTLRFKNTGTLRDWLGAGAIREDDYLRRPDLQALGCTPAENPQDPQAQVDRPLNHFFDVQRGGSGLTLASGLFQRLPAPDWALGLQGRGPNPDQNRFSILDARIYQLASLTGSTRAERDRSTALLFRTLGQVTHVLQDMAQPQHTRNDPHLGCLEFLGAGEHSWYEEYLEKRARRETFRTRGDVAPPLRLDGYDPVQFGAYRDFWANAQGSGLAELSSRNFFSAGTNLSFRNVLFGSLLGGCGGLPEPPCRLDAYRAQPATFSVRSVDGTTLSGTVTSYRRDMTDPVTGAAIADVAVSSRSLWDQHLETRQLLPNFTLNTLNYDSISDVLLPRAVGYSAGFLDYFFRARLDVDLVSDGTDPSVARITGTNNSPDTLVDGTLTLYADDSTTGTRSPVTAPGSTAIANVLPGGAVTSAPLQIPDGAERFVAVYQGTLGTEVKSPDQNVPGGVIGKVLGGVRVEEIFQDADQWKMRTPQGVFLLRDDSGPLTGARFANVKWGDGANLLVAQTPFGPGEPNRVVAYEVPRRPNTLEPATDGANAVPLLQRTEAALPTGSSLGSTVQFRQTRQYRGQQVMRVVSKRVWVWHPESDGFYLPEGYEFENVRFESLVDRIPIVYSLDLPIVMDEAHGVLFGDWPIPNYFWDLVDVGVDGSGRLLGLVSVTLTREPEVVVPRFPLYEADIFGTITLVGEVEVPAVFPRINTLLWAVVDLTNRTVLATTADPVIRLEAHEVMDAGPYPWLPGSGHPDGGYIAERKIVFRGGERDGQEIDGGQGFVPFEPHRRFSDLVTSFIPIQSSGGFQAVAASGALQAELARELGRVGAGVEFRVAGTPIATDLVYGCLTTYPQLADCQSLRVEGTNWEIAGTPTEISDARRSPPAPGNERLALIFDTGDVLTWDPAGPRARARHRVTGDFALFDTVTSAMALVRSGVFGHFGDVTYSSALIPLEGADPVTEFPGRDLGEAFALLDAKHLYGLGELRFFRFRPLLEQTALPAKLADVPGNPRGSYHTIRLP